MEKLERDPRIRAEHGHPGQWGRGVDLKGKSTDEALRKALDGGNDISKGTGLIKISLSEDHVSWPKRLLKWLKSLTKWG